MGETLTGQVVKAHAASCEARQDDRTACRVLGIALIAPVGWLISFATLVVLARVHDGTWPVAPIIQYGWPGVSESPSTDPSHWDLFHGLSLAFAVMAIPCLVVAGIVTFVVRDSARRRRLVRCWLSVVTLLLVAGFADGSEWIRWWLS